MAEKTSANDLAQVVAQLPRESAGLDSLDVKNSEGYSERLVDSIEMIGEEQAAYLPNTAITPGMRYLHCSRTIHQLVTDRNRAVGIYLAVASLLLTASSALCNANPRGEFLIPFTTIQRWCLPLTFGTLTVLSVLIGLLLVRTRVGLIYEVAKMNALLGLPVGRVSRLNPLSIFFLLQLLVSLGGGLSGALFCAFLLAYAYPTWDGGSWAAALMGAGISAALLATYSATVQWTTSEQRLQKGIGG